MRKIYTVTLALFIVLGLSAQPTTIDISAISSNYTKTFDGELVIDVATASSPVAAALVSFDNPFKGKTFTEAEISFDVYNYHGVDSIKVLGSLVAIWDAAIGRMYFSNGSYLGYNDGEFYDANLINYGIGTDFLGGNTWKKVQLQFTPSGYAMYVDGTLAFDQSSTSVTIAGNLSDYNRVITFFQNASSFVIGTGSWWSDNTRPDGTYWDAQFSYLKNIRLTPNFSAATSVNEAGIDLNGEVVSEEFYSITGVKLGSDFQTLKPGVYVKKATYSNGMVKTNKIGKIN
jgi:hypothetical protein